METTFHNVTITIEAETPKAAYAKLCEILQAGVAEGILEYETADFCTDDDPDNDRSTEELFPNTEAETIAEMTLDEAYSDTTDRKEA